MILSCNCQKLALDNVFFNYFILLYYFSVEKSSMDLYMHGKKYDLLRLGLGVVFFYI